jgi:hypothetical protein
MEIFQSPQESLDLALASSGFYDVTRADLTERLTMVDLDFCLRTHLQTYYDLVFWLKWKQLPQELVGDHGLLSQIVFSGGFLRLEKVAFEEKTELEYLRVVTVAGIEVLYRVVSEIFEIHGLPLPLNFDENYIVGLLSNSLLAYFSAIDAQQIDYED